MKPSLRHPLDGRLMGVVCGPEGGGAEGADAKSCRPTTETTNWARFRAGKSWCRKDKQRLTDEKGIDQVGDDKAGRGKRDGSRKNANKEQREQKKDSGRVAD